MAIAIVLIGATILVVDVILTWNRYQPRIAALVDSVPGRTMYMALRAREGRPPRARAWMPLDALPTVVVCAVVASENVNYFRPGTLDWTNQRQLFGRIFRGDFSRGSSGITQQLARNLFLSPERTPLRKLREYVLAFGLSSRVSKERQLELYLNLVEWGEGVWGVAAGSRDVFHRPPDSLTPTQAIVLANMLPAPARGPAFPLSRPRREKLERVAAILWRQGVFDELTWSATTARLRRIGEAIDLGHPPDDAARMIEGEMGPEARVATAFDDPGLPWSARCDHLRRGAT